MVDLAGGAACDPIQFRLDLVRSHSSVQSLMKTVNIHEAKTHFSRLVDEAAGGEEIIVARAGKPAARLMPIASMKKRRMFGALKGKIRIAADFDSPLPESVLMAFEGR